MIRTTTMPNTPNDTNEADCMSSFASLSQRFADLEAQHRADRQRFRVLCGVLLGAVTLAVSLPFVSPALAQGYGMTLAQAATRIAALETKTASLTTLTDSDGNATVRFTNVNVQIVSGSGKTDGAINGRGNLIVGYNEGISGSVHTGSHNLITGQGQTYTSYSGVVFGIYSIVSAPYASVSGGYYNKATGTYASVSGGDDNTASGDYASVSGGYNNMASGSIASVSGGDSNIAGGGAASVSGGFLNTANSLYASVSSGSSNTASGTAASVSGGTGNVASGDASTISGGANRTTATSASNSWRAGSLFQAN